MKYFLFSLSLFLVSCASSYKGMIASPVAGCLEKFGHGVFGTSWYTAGIDVYGRHLSGLLLVKRMEDKSYRMVFTNEAGVTFFDFEFSDSGAFSVRRVIKQLDRKPVINTLKDDFALLLGLYFRGVRPVVRYNDGEVFYGVNQKKRTAYFITDPECASLRRLELGSKRKSLVSIDLDGNRFMPDKIVIRHHSFDMVINLKKIERE
jgi:hypothetical protein